MRGFVQTGDGNTLAIGAINEGSNGTGIGSDELNNAALNEVCPFFEWQHLGHRCLQRRQLRQGHRWQPDQRFLEGFRRGVCVLTVDPREPDTSPGIGTGSSAGEATYAGNAKKWKISDFEPKWLDSDPASPRNPIARPLPLRHDNAPFGPVSIHGFEDARARDWAR